MAPSASVRITSVVTQYYFSFSYHQTILHPVTQHQFRTIVRLLTKCFIASMYIVLPHNFTDLNECELPDNAGCSHTCTNTEGSYICGCPVGLQLSNNQHTCVGESTFHISLVDTAPDFGY